VGARGVRGAGGGGGGGSGGGAKNLRGGLENSTRIGSTLQFSKEKEKNRRAKLSLLKGERSERGNRGSGAVLSTTQQLGEEISHN